MIRAADEVVEGDVEKVREEKQLVKAGLGGAALEVLILPLGDLHRLGHLHLCHMPLSA